MAKPLPEDIENRLYINGEFTESASGKTFDVHSPFDHSLVSKVYEADATDVDKAVAAAKAAFPAWSALQPNERGKYMRVLANIVEEEAMEDLALLDAACMGRPISTYFDSASLVGAFRFYSEAGWTAQGATSLNTKGFVNMVVKQPVGVVGIIIPWNVSMTLFGDRVSAALAAGCTVVVKSSEKTPLSALRMAQCFSKAGFPPGVINILSGFGPTAGAPLASHMDVRAISFTGSQAAGRLVAEMAAKSNLKKVFLELGGKNPSIVFADADLEKAAQETAFSIRFNSGQACIATSRIYVEEAAAEQYRSAFAKAFSNMKVGNPLDPSTNYGPQADRKQFERVKEYMQLAKEGKGRIVMGGEEMKFEGGDGFFLQPTIIWDQAETDRPMKEEIFGSVVGINTFKTEEEAIAKATATEYGLYSSVYTCDINRALRVAMAMESGMCAVNCTSPTRAADLGFGGFKGSGNGREGYMTSMEQYLQTKSVFVKVNEK